MKETEDASTLDRDRLEFWPGGFVSTREHRRFENICRDATRYGHIALCVGPAGVGKTRSARRYASWDVLEPLLYRFASDEDPPPEVVQRRSAYYCAPPSNTPKSVTNGIERGRNLVSWFVDLSENGGDEVPEEGWAEEDRTELVVVDEAQFLRNQSLEQLRYLYDHGDFGLVLIGMPGLEKALARYKQFYSRIGQVHKYSPLPEQPVRRLLESPSLFGTRLTHEALPEDAVVAIMSACRGNFRTLQRLVRRIERVLETNGRKTASTAVVRKARDQLLFGTE